MTQHGIVHSPPAYCPIHGIFPASMIGMNNSGVDIIANVAVPCPACGLSATVLPGSYRAIGPRLNFALAATVDPLAREALLALLQELDQGRIDTEQAAKRAESIKPGLSRLFLGLSPGMRQTLVGGLLVVLGAGIGGNFGYRAAVDSAEVNAEALLRAAEIQAAASNPSPQHRPPDIRRGATRGVPEDQAPETTPIPTKKPSRQVRRRIEREARKDRGRRGIDI